MGLDGFLGTRVRGAIRAALRACGWFGRLSAIGTHSARYLPSSLVHGIGAGSLVGALRCSRDTALSTILFYLSTTLILISNILLFGWVCTTSILAFALF